MLKLRLLTSYKNQNVVKKFVCCYYNKIQYKQSFQYRIINYFENEFTNIFKSIKQLEISLAVKENIPEIRNLNKKLELIYNELSYLSNTNTKITEQILYDFDIKCTSVVNLLTHSDILRLLTALLKVFPRYLIKMNFYNKTILILVDAADMNLLNKEEIIELFFFLSLQKEKGNVYVKYLKPYMPDLNEMSLMEKCIISQAFFKTSVKLEPFQSRIMEKELEKNCVYLINDHQALVSLCKIIRISGVSEELNLEYLSEAIMKLDKSFSFTTTVHVLALYAEALVFHSEVINYLLAESVDTIKKNNYSIRLKDVDRFFYSISTLGVTVTSEMKNVFKIFIEQRLNQLKLKQNLGLLVNSLLCLHMLQCYNTNITEKCFQENVFLSVFEEVHHWKVRGRFQLFISQLDIELKMVIPNVLKKQIRFGYTSSKNIKVVEDVGLSLANKGIVNTTIIECPIATLLIPGVTLKTKKNKYHIDVLDNTTCLKNRNTPHGLMSLKSRLLSCLGYHHILINRNIFEEDLIKTKITIEQQILSSMKNYE